MRFWTCFSGKSRSGGETDNGFGYGISMVIDPKSIVCSLWMRKMLKLRIVLVVPDDEAMSLLKFCPLSYPWGLTKGNYPRDGFPGGPMVSLWFWIWEK